MRFEEPVNRYAARFSELDLYRRGQAMPRVGHEEIHRAIARGRGLHGKFCRRILKAVLARPLVAILSFAGRTMVSIKRKLDAERARLATIRNLAALDDRMLRDIGIERGNIPFVAECLAHAVSRKAPSTAPASKTIFTRGVFLTMRAA